MNINQLYTLREELYNDPTGIGYNIYQQDYPAIVEKINTRPIIPNPIPQTNVANPPTWIEVMGTLPAAKRAAIFASSSLAQLCIRTYTAGDNANLNAVLVWVSGQGIDIEATTLLKTLKSISEALELTILTKYLTVLAVDFTLDTPTKTALLALVTRTKLDPTWQATIPGNSRAMTLGLPVIVTSDVQQVLNR